MANVLVFVEVADGRPAGGSLRALAEGRRVATELGATVYAVATCAAPPAYGENDLVAVLSRHGADRVVLATGAELVGRAAFATHGAAMQSVCERFPPALVLFANDATGRDIAPRLAARIGAAFAARTNLAVDEEGVLALESPVYGGTFRRRLEVDELERSVVATVEPDGPLSEGATDEVEALVVPVVGSGGPAPVRREGAPVEGTVAGTIRVAVMIRRTAKSPREADAQLELGACDQAALATALRLREAGAVQLTAISCGPEAENATLELACRLGADRAIRLWHPALDGTDYHALSRALAGVARATGADVVLIGESSDDERLGGLGPALAEHLGVVHASGVREVTRAGAAIAFRQDDGAWWEARAPIVLVVGPGATLGAPDPLAVPGAIDVWDLGKVQVAPEEIRHRRRYLGKLIGS